MSDQQFQYVQTDERNNFTTMLRPIRINQGSAPISPGTQPKIDHPARIIYIQSEAELIATTKDYEVNLDSGDMAILPDMSTGRTRLFVFVGANLGWQEIQLSDHLDAHNILYFKSNIEVVERGSVIHALSFDWDLKIDVQYLSIDDVGEFPQGSKSGAAFDLNIFDDTTFTLLATDGKVPSKETCNIYFRDKIYYGSSSRDTLTEDEVKSLNYSLQKDIKSRFSFTCNDEYIYIAIPSDIDNPTFVASELQYCSFEKQSLDITNKHGHRANYDIYRTTYKQMCNDLIITII